MAGEELAKKYQSAIYLAGSASAEFFADIALCPFEAVKVCASDQDCRSPCTIAHAFVLNCGVQVKVQTVPGFARGLTDGFPKFIALEGTAG